MNRRMIIAAVLVGLLGLAFAGSALANGTQDGVVEEHEECGGEMAGWHRGGMFGSDAIGDLLGLTSQEIREQRIAGQSLVEIAAAQGISEETLVEAILAEMTSIMQQKIADGTPTQDQADSILQWMEERIVEMVNLTAGEYGEDDGYYGRMMGQGGMGMYGGMMGKGGMRMHGDHDDHDHDGGIWSGFARGAMGWGRGMH